MAIQRIEITGYCSLKDITFEASNIVALIGQNGSGKSNILSAINYFYKNLTEEKDEKDIFDNNNQFRNEISIRITYDLKNILRIIQRNNNLEKVEYEKYYQKVIAIARNDKIILELRKRKGKCVLWNVDYNIRQIIKSLFPIYFVDARQIELTDWTDVWNLIGDLLKLRTEDSDGMQNGITEMIHSQDANLEEKIFSLKSTLSKQGINVKKLTSKQLGKIIAEMTVGGQVFQYGNRNLWEYSNGTNAYNFTNLLLGILGLMKRYKLKEPIVILDEPEISLHHMMVDRLMEKIFDNSLSIQFFMSTHSSRSVKDMLEWESSSYEIYHVMLKNSYSQIKKVRHLSAEENRERIIVTEAYTNSCFAKMVLNVEGETELEVLKNKYLREIFPFLREADIVTGMSNRTIYNLTSPSKRNFQTAGQAVIDMDKVLEWLPAERHMRFKGLEVELISNEAYHYGRKRKDTLYLRKRIECICAKCNFYFKYPFYSCQDENFSCLQELVINYCNNYNIHVWKTTIEGALITADNLSLFRTFIECKGLNSSQIKLIESYWKRWDDHINLNYIRQIFSGKGDFLLTKKQLIKNNPNIYMDLFQTLGMKKKTCGWVSQWLEYYFLDKLGIDKNSVGCFKQFSMMLKVGNNRNMILLDMRRDFHELSSLLDQIEKRMTFH